jgi:hypothetical protein
MCFHVFGGKRHKTHIANNVDISLRRIKGRQFTAFMDARRSRINSRRLAPNIVDRCKTVEQQLPHHNRPFRSWQPGIVTERRWGNITLVSA